MTREAIDRGLAAPRRRAAAAGRILAAPAAPVGDPVEITATTTVETIQEFTHVRARRRGRADAVDLANDYVELLSPLLVVDDTDLREGLRLFVTSQRLGSFDAVLAPGPPLGLTPPPRSG